MRRQILIRSVRRLLADDVDLVDVVFMWRRPSHAPLWAAAAAVAVYGVLSMLGYGSASSRVGLAVATAVIATVLATHNRVLAHTSEGVYLFVASRFRQVAVASLGPLGPDAAIELIGSNLVLTDWSVDGVRYSVPKRSQAAMTLLADVA